jgi:outer membrane receptor for ferrienterochelin and colicin
MIAFTLVLSATAQNGSISGQVRDFKTAETLPGANIMIEGSVSGTITDFDGCFALEALQPGTYAIRISYISYEAVILTGIQVEAGKNTTLEIKLKEATTTIDAVSIVATRRTDTEMSVLNSVRAHPLVANGLSSKQIAMSQDKDASEAIRRVPGVTIVENRFVVIRGLNQRYNNVWLNNAPAPGSESDSRAFSFDIIPSQMIDNLMIYKSLSPDLPADLTGGFVNISTKNMPEKNQYVLGLQAGVNPQATFANYYTYAGGSLDWLGMDDGTRSLPSYFPANLQSASGKDQVELSKRLNNNWGPQSAITMPDSKLSFMMSHRFQIGQTSLGEITTVNYGMARNFIRSLNRSFSVYNFEEDQSALDFDFTDSTFTNSVNLGILNNWSWYLGKGNKLEFRNLLSNQAESSTLFRNGTEYYSNTVIRSFEYGYKSRLTYSGQLSGTHSLGEFGGKIDWTLGYSYAHRNEPDIRRIKQILNDNITDAGYGRYFLELPSNPLSSTAGRIFMGTTENLLSGAVNYEKSFAFGNFRPKIKAGAYFEQKVRHFSARKLGYIYSNGSQKDVSIQYLDIAELLTERYFNNTSGIKLAEETGKSDSYEASNRHVAGYLAANLPVTKRIGIWTGIRVESNSQDLSSYDRFQQPVSVKLDTVNFFPSANVTFTLNDKNQFRLAYGNSINRPEFREIAPFPFYDFRSNAVFSGNPDLLNAYIHNFDLRYEVYPETGELISIGAFYKKFLNPIEIKYIETGSGLEYSYQNALSATNYGIEAEIRKSLSEEGWLRNMVLVFNGAWIHSVVDFEAGSVERDRPLAGQSPYVLNLGLFYSESEKARLNFSLLYNVIGPRIYIVGQPKSQSWEYIPDIYEMPRHLVDLTVSKRIGKYLEIKLGIKDLLNQPVVFTQSIDTDADLSVYGSDPSGMVHFSREQIYREYRPGSSFSLGIQATF